MSRYRSAFTQHLDAQAYAVRVGGQWFAGFGGPKGAPIVKLRRHLCDALLMVSQERGLDYVDRLAKRGHPGGCVRTIQLAGDL